jgi:hypothetical protein
MKDVKELLRSIRFNEQAVKEHKDELIYSRGRAILNGFLTIVS